MNNINENVLNELIKLFEQDRLPLTYLYCNITNKECKAFYRKISDEPNKYFVGKQLSNTQKYLYEHFFCIVRCKRNDCVYHHSRFIVDECDECIKYDKKTYNDLLKEFDEDKLTTYYLYTNLSTKQCLWFYTKVTDHLNKHYIGKQLSENQKILCKRFDIVRCKRNDCEYYHSKNIIDTCDECIN